MIKRIVPVFMFVILFFGLTLPQNSNAVFEQNLNAAQTKPVAKSAVKRKVPPVVAKHANAKYRAIQKIREAQKILDNAFGPGAIRVNRSLNRMNHDIALIRQVR